MLSYESALAKARKDLETGVSIEIVIANLASQGGTILEAIKIVREAASVSLGHAKMLVSSHDAWKSVVEKNRPLHDAAEAASQLTDEELLDGD